MAEETFFSEAGITVTKTLLTTPVKSVSIANVASVSKWVDVPKKTLPIVLIVVGVLTIALFGIGLIPLAIGIVMLIVNKKSFGVHLESSGASSTAFSSKDEALVDRIVKAVAQAIAARG